MKHRTNKNNTLRINQNKHFMWTRLAVEVDWKNASYSTTPLDGIYRIEPEQTSGNLRECFEKDLVNGSDRFLLGVYEVGEDGYAFEMIMRTSDIKTFVEYEDKLADFLIRQGVTKPSVITVR